MSDETEAVRKEAEALRRDRERVAAAAEREAVRARRDAERADRDQARAADAAAKAERAAAREAERRQAERERAVREAEREAARAQREAQKAAVDAMVAAQRAARQLERVRRRAQDAGLTEPPPDVDLPRELAVLWRTPEPGRRGPRPGLTLAQITAASIALADAEGLAAVSMARVAERLGVTTMALYRYVSSKDELLALMADTAVGEARGPDPWIERDGSGWRAALETWCRVQLDVARAHPWVAGLASTSPAMGPNRLWWLEVGLRSMAGTPLSMSERTEVIGRLSLNLLSEASLLAALDELGRAAAAPDADADVGAGKGSGTEQAQHPALVDYGGLLRLLADPDVHSEIFAALDAGAFDADPGEEYDADFGLRLMLDGVAALVERAAARATRAPVDDRGRASGAGDTFRQ